MSVAVFKPEIWSKNIQMNLETITGLRKHSDYSFTNEIKGMGTVLHIAGAVRPSTGTYVPGTDITFEPVSGISHDLPIDKFRYSAITLDDVDRAQAIPGVFEATSREMAESLADMAEEEVAKVLKSAVESGVSYTNASDQTAIETIAQEASASAPAKDNAIARIDDGLTKLYENNVKQTTSIWGEFSPKYFQYIREKLTELYTNNVEMAKKGIVGRYYNVDVTIQNLLPTNTAGTIKYNFLRTGKAVAYAEQVNKTEAGRHEKQFGDYLKSLLVFGCAVIRPKEMYAIKETVTPAGSN